MPEKTIVDNALEYLNNLPLCWAIKTHGGEYQTGGLADVFGCLNGLLFALEGKVPGKKPDPRQEKVLRDISKAKGYTGSFTSMEEIKTHVAEMQIRIGKWHE